MSAQSMNRGVRTAYTLAARQMLADGLSRIEQAYQAYPDMHPRTIRRIWEEVAVLMGREELQGKDPPSVTLLPLDSINTITERAKEAGVRAKAALSAAMRFGNPVDRVLKVLDDIVTLGRVHKPAYRPTGLFIQKMRTGEDVMLPEIVLEQREALEADRRAPLVVGEWVRWNQEWHRVMETNGLHAQLSPSGDPLDVYKQPCDGLLHLPRRSDAPS